MVLKVTGFQNKHVKKLVLNIVYSPYKMVMDKQDNVSVTMI